MKRWIVGKHGRLSCYDQQNACTKIKNCSVSVEGGGIMQITTNFTSHLEIPSTVWTEQSGSLPTTFMLACTLMYVSSSPLCRHYTSALWLVQEGNLEGDAFLACDEEGQTQQPCSLEVACGSCLIRANTPTQAHSLWAMCHGYYILECATVGLKTTLEHLQNYLLEVSVGFRSIAIKLSLLQRTDSSPPKKTISHWSIKSLLIKEENTVIH